tara:strand:- start:187 stop:432 length:246 start_codon:yes stop_codon:yes gene_type:complete
MIDKKISLGTIITLITIVATFIYTQGATSSKLEAIESDSSDNNMKIISNRNKVQDIEVKVAGIEAKIDEGFKRLETLIIEN